MTFSFLKAQAEIRKIFLLVFCFFILTPAFVFAAHSYYALPGWFSSRIVQKGQLIPDWLQVWNSARDSVNNQQFEEAVVQYETLLAAREDLIQPRWELARLLIFLKKYDPAAGHLEYLLKIAGETPSYLNALGYIMDQEGHNARALEFFQKAYGLDQTNIQALQGICHIMVKSGQVGDSVRFLEKLFLLTPDDIAVKRRLAAVYYQLGFFEKARFLAASLAAESTATEADYRLAAHIYDALGLENISLRYWRQVIAAQPDDHEARWRSALFCQKDGRFAQSLEHLLVLQKSEPDNYDLLFRLGLVYQALKQYDQAMDCMTKIIAHDPNNKKALQAVVEIQTILGNEEKTLAGIERYLEVEKKPSSASLKHAAELYDAVGRYAEAVKLYRRLLLQQPGDKKIIAALARDLQAIGADAAALALWRDMLKITPEPRPVYLAMIAPLERLGRNDKLITVLEELRRLGARDPEIGLKLVLLYLDQGWGKQGRALFMDISTPDSATAEFYFLQGKIFEKLSCPAKALASYEQAQRLSPDDRDIQLNCLRLAGYLGLVDKVDDKIAAIKAAGLLMDWRARLIAANARRDCGEDYQALIAYQTIIDEEGSWNNDCALNTLFALAELYSRQHRFFEAEQGLRRALLLRHEQTVVYGKLVELALRAHDDDMGRQWLVEFRRFADGLPENRPRNNYIDLLELRLLNLSGKYRLAGKKGRKLLPFFSSADRQMQRKFFKAVIDSELGLGNNEEAIRDSRRMLRRYPDDLLFLVLLEKAQQEEWDDEETCPAADPALTIAKRDKGRLLRLAELYAEYEMTDSMLRAATLARQKMPDSLRAISLLGRAESKTDRRSEVLALYNEALLRVPANSRLLLESAGLCSLTGAYGQGIRLCDDLLANEPERADVILLKARMLWALQQWDESFKVYHHYLKRDIEDVFLKKSRSQGLEMNFPPAEKKFRQLLPFAELPRQDNLAPIMAVSFAADRNQDGINHLAIPLYAEYRWHDYFYMELAARNSLQRREYFQSVKEFENLHRKNPDDQTLLFDLAGIYSRLGRLGDEALIYAEINRENSNYPGLTEATERNRLKRRPQSTLAWHYDRKKGWSGYQAMEQQSGIALFRYQPFFRHQFDFSASRISYRSTDNGNKLSANRFQLSYKTGLFDWLDVSVGAGAEGLADGYADTGLLKLALEGKTGDKITGRLAFSRDVVTDTTASLSRNIVAEKSSAGIAFDLFPRLLVSGDCRYIKYSDDNELDGYNFRALVILFTEPTYLEFTYSYDFQDARESKRQGGALLDDGFAVNDHPYWAPGDYWYNRFRLYFKHMLSGDTLGRGAPSYYTAEYFMDYDVNGHTVQKIKGEIFVEVTPHVMLESRAAIVSSDQIREREFFISAIYRW